MESRKSSSPSNSNRSKKRSQKDILLKLAEELTHHHLAEDLMKKAVNTCRTLLRADACAIFLVEEDKETLVMQASTGYKNDLSVNVVHDPSKIAKYKLIKLSDSEEKLGVTSWIARTGNTFITNKREDFLICDEYAGKGKYDEELHGVEDKDKCQSFFGAPLKTWDRILGVLKVESFKENHFKPEDIDNLQIIAAMITISLQNLMTIRKLRSLFERIGRDSGDRNLFNDTARTCGMLVQAEACSIFIFKQETKHLVMRGDYGHHESFVDDETKKNSYDLSDKKRTTWKVFAEGQEYEKRRGHENRGKLYPRQWKNGKKHICFSWFQFPIKDGDQSIGVMKVENKLGIAGKPLKKMIFSDSDKNILRTLADSMVPLIVSGQLKMMKERAFATLSDVGRIQNIDEIFNRNLLDEIERIKTPRLPELHNSIIDFIGEVKKLRAEDFPRYLEFTKQSINKIGKSLGLVMRFLTYCESLKEFEPILYLLDKYRAHYVHQLNVFFNGYLILNKVDASQFDRIEKILSLKTETAKFESIDVFKSWFVTAIFHDTGYPLGKAGKWTETFLERFFKSDQSKKKEKQDISSKIVETISMQLFRRNSRSSLQKLLGFLNPWLPLDPEKKESLSDHIHDCFFSSLSENLIAGLLLIKASEDNNIPAHITSTAVSAIVLDDRDLWEFLRKCGENVHPLSFLNHPLSFLLVFCDTIQEHGRPKNMDKVKRGDISKVKDQVYIFKDNEINCHLTYTKKPEDWDKIRSDIINKALDSWKTEELRFGIYYKSEDEGEFNNAVFNL